jgi:hypothetical protein
MPVSDEFLTYVLEDSRELIEWAKRSLAIQLSKRKS